MHARRLAAAGLLTESELLEVEQGLPGATYEPGDEDVHSAIERSLGEVGRKIHAGRSRNDQVAQAFRLYVQAACDEAAAGIDGLVEAIESQASDAPMPGYTHLQRA